MTREEILNTPEIVDFMIDKSVMEDSKMKLHKRLDELCKLAIKALEQEPKFVVKSDGTIEQIKNCNDCLLRKEWEKIGKMLSAVLEKQMEQKPKTDVLDKIDEIITDALDKSTDQKESQTLRWVLDKISEVQNE